MIAYGVLIENNIPNPKLYLSEKFEGKAMKDIFVSQTLLNATENDIASTLKDETWLDLSVQYST